MKTFARTFRSICFMLALLVVGWGGVYAQTVQVTIPNTAVQPGSTVNIPINVGSLTGLSVTAYEFVVSCDTTILRFTGVNSTGTLSDGLGPVANYYVSPFGPGKMKVTCATATDMSGVGVLVYLTGTAQTGSGNTSVSLSNFLFNTGTPGTNITNGSLRLNRAPTMSSVAAKTVAEKDTLRFTAGATDPDLPNDTLSFSLSGAPTGATINPSTGVFTWSPNFGVAGSYSFRIKVTDLGLASDSTTVSVTVTHTNRPPSFVTKMKDTTINQGSTLSFSFSATDPDFGTVIAYSLLNGPSGASISSSGVFSFTPPANPSRTYSIVAIASDGSLADTAKATVTVNRKPSIVSKAPATLTILSQNKSTLFSVSTVNPDGGALTFQWKVNGVVDKSGPDSTYTKSFADANGTSKSVVCVASNSVGLKDSVTWSFTITDVERNNGGIPAEFALGQNYPNPFNPSTTIRFDLPKEAPVTLEIYNVLGVRVRSLLAGQVVSAGNHSMVWDGHDDNGISLPSGVYLYRISAADFQASRKMTMLK
jgi:flagellar hook assembly protein FlgD